MIDQRYDIYFSGQLLPDRDPDQVRQAVGQLFSAEDKMLERLFSGQPVRIKRAVDQDTAATYRLRFRDAGALIDIRPVRQETDAPADRVSPATAVLEPELELLPPRTGSLADCAPKIAPAELPDISRIGLAPPGQPLDQRTPPPSASIATDGMTLSPPRTGSLADCQSAPEPAPAPDISKLRLELPVEDD